VNRMFQYLDLETISVCNRFCPTCLRNSHPNKDEIGSWFVRDILPIPIIKEALRQCVELGFSGGVCLSHYNEPLLDTRIAQIAHIVREHGQFKPIYLHTNGDYLTQDIATELDGALDKIVVSLYMEEPQKSRRAEWIPTLFDKTEAVMITQSAHVATHYSPSFDVEKLAKRHINRPCVEPQIRVIINHRRQYLLCCDDVIGNFDLGTFPEMSIKEYWFGEKRMKIMNDLKEGGGRLKYDYCTTCPRP